MPLSDVLFVLLSIALMAACWKDLKDTLERLHNFFGGPPGPMAPLPSSDSHLLLKRSGKKQPCL
ncbi:MAG TPA: hypothetical protein VMB03_34050 [Bryobacteraceae bacterium]|nr:hypothetical protein [Bryobacteraceae bacterium]